MKKDLEKLPVGWFITGLVFGWGILALCSIVCACSQNYNGVRFVGKLSMWLTIIGAVLFLILLGMGSNG